MIMSTLNGSGLRVEGGGFRNEFLGYQKDFQWIEGVQTLGHHEVVR